MRSRTLATTVSLSILCIIFAISVWAAWLDNGVQVSFGDASEIYPYIAPDGSGGAYIVWEQVFTNPFLKNSIYIKRIATNGNLLWGTSLSPDTTIAWSPVDIAPDGAGGALVCWTDGRDSGTNSRDIYAQRLDANGNKHWPTYGAEVYTGPDDQDYPCIVSDGVGGAVVVWRDDRNGNDDLRTQRLDSNGNMLWPASGVEVCGDPSDQRRHRIESDSTGGVIITWDDDRIGGSNNIYAQRVDSVGTARWTLDGILVSAVVSHKTKPQLVSDGTGGAIITWEEHSRILYAQRVDASGDTLWTESGVVIYDYYIGARTDPQIASDGAGGAVLCWNDSRTPRGIYAQRINADGDTLWNGEGVPIGLAVGTQYDPRIASDGSGGAAIAWKEALRQAGDHGDVYARTVDANGNAQGPANGTALCTASTEQRYVEIATDGAGGGIVSWQDTRNYAETEADIYAARVYFNGATGTVTPDSPEAGFLSQNFPNPFNPSTTIVYGLEEPGAVSLRVYDASGRLVSVLVDGARDARQYTETWDGRNMGGRSVASGVYFYRLIAPGIERTRKMVLLR